MNTLKSIIKKYGAAKLAREVGVSKTMVSLVMSGEREFGFQVAKKVAKLLNVSRSMVRPDIWDEDIRDGTN